MAACLLDARTLLVELSGTLGDAHTTHERRCFGVAQVEVVCGQELRSQANTRRMAMSHTCLLFSTLLARSTYEISTLFISGCQVFFF